MPPTCCVGFRCRTPRDAPHTLPPQDHLEQEENEEEGEDERAEAEEEEEQDEEEASWGLFL